MNAQTVLIIDDDIDDRLFFCEALKEANLHLNCEGAMDGVYGLDALKKSDILPALIFLDINMPRMGGMECLTELKKDETLKHIPVVIYTTTKTPEAVELARSLGAAHFVQKPIFFEDIVHCVTKLIAQYSLAI